MTFLFSNPFLLFGLLASMAAACASGVIGSYVVIKRIVSLSGSIAHSVLGGMGLCLFLKRSYGIEFLTPLYGALLAGIGSALLMGWIHLKYQEREDTVIAALWAAGMSIGVIFIALTPGYNVELLNFLFGNILWVSQSDLFLLLGLNLLILSVVALCYYRFLALSFDPEYAQLRGLRVSFFYLLLLCLVAISIVLLIQVVGAILVIALLAIPAAIAGSFTKKLSWMMCGAVLLGCIFATVGMSVSYFLNWPPGATICLIAASTYALTLRKL